MQSIKNRLRDENVRAALIFAALVLILVVVVLAARQPHFTCEDTRPPGEARASPRTRFVVERQVIVIGPKSAVEAVLGDLVGISLVKVRDCDLSILGELLGDQELGESLGDQELGEEGAVSFLFQPEVRRELVLRLYRVEGEQLAGEVVEAINNAGNSRLVFADPNLLMGPDSDSVGGSPLRGGPKLLPVGEASAEMFWKQWAFRQAGVGPTLKDALTGALIEHTGAGILVAVFDTVPFIDPGAVLETQEIVKWLTPTMDVEPLELKVSYPEMSNILSATESGATMPNPLGDVRDHGLYVAGLIHAVAPESKIHLIRVLNQFGVGDLQTLNESLIQFVVQMINQRKTLEGVVLNLSLGVHQPKKEDVDKPIVGEDAQELLRLQDPLETLSAVLFTASKRGAVVVAAAGNDSRLDTVPPPPPQIPANYRFVIGVKASNADRGRACFSNEEEVFAPGGDGCPAVKGDDSHVATLQACQGDCEVAVIGLILFPPKLDAYWPTHYAYWRGTSFSTPLVSGLAALALQAGVSPADVAKLIKAGASGKPWTRTDVSPSVVVPCNASPGDGVINIPDTLLLCLP